MVQTTSEAREWSGGRQAHFGFLCLVAGGGRGLAGWLPPVCPCREADVLCWALRLYVAYTPALVLAILCIAKLDAFRGGLHGSSGPGDDDAFSGSAI